MTKHPQRGKATKEAIATIPDYDCEIADYERQACKKKKQEQKPATEEEKETLWLIHKGWAETGIEDMRLKTLRAHVQTQIDNAVKTQGAALLHTHFKGLIEAREQQAVEKAFKDHLRIGSPEMELLFKAKQTEQDNKAVEKAIGKLEEPMAKHFVKMGWSLNMASARIVVKSAIKAARWGKK